MIVRKFTAVLRKKGDLYLAECPEVGTLGRGSTREEALTSLKEETESYFESLLALKRSPFLRRDLSEEGL